MIGKKCGFYAFNFILLASDAFNNKSVTSKFDFAHCSQ